MCKLLERKRVSGPKTLTQASIIIGNNHGVWPLKVQQLLSRIEFMSGNPFWTGLKVFGVLVKKYSFFSQNILAFQQSLLLDM